MENHDERVARAHHDLLKDPRLFFSDLSEQFQAIGRLRAKLTPEVERISDQIERMGGLYKILCSDSDTHELLAEYQHALEMAVELEKFQKNLCNVMDSIYETQWNATRNPLYVWWALSSNRCSPPKWCLDYMHDCARKICDMADDETIDAQTCAVKIPSMLGLTKPGWNSFREYRLLDESLEMLAELKAYRREGMSPQSASNEILSRFGLENERSMRRRIAAIKRALTRRKPNKT
jgi:hypothetical protein